MSTTLSAGQTIADIDQRLLDMRSKTQERINSASARLTDELEVAGQRHAAEAEAMAFRHKQELAAIRDEYTWFHNVLAEQEADVNAARGDDSTVVEFKAAAE